ncbi:MAG: hypothetical protein HOD43_00220 [Candidatus Marinimicrobia bacterium]|jgi:hypothetical protein|nr:hypothetical protein [Candidatus Neomarinimicrobiota bacterium]MBT3632383.1 hypothetical protein [Candidatus Neomarinimicrobiota bacterium]MBT3825831.1 hypothetical protein [Candidatus Neomarinimicrobiota bacterium]MBT4129917.1 hypothetical protein [Candidatus Neomarinimicrobiota bacterium]MBT4294212.1 hypothetical protein [Candidatus Neomarinimicrobiota bacterium]
MKITVKELTTVGPTIHSSFATLPYQRSDSGQGSLSRPILAYQSPSCIKIVGDTHRFLAAQEAGEPTVPVYLIQDTESTLELIQLIIEYYSPMNLMDKAFLTRAAIDLGVPRPMLAEQILPALELAPREKLIDQVLFLLKLPTSLQSFIVDKDLSLKRALIFQRAEGHLEWVERFIANLKIGINMSAEIIQNVWEMSKNDEVDFKTKAQEMGLWEMADTAYEDNRLAVMEIREKINQARFPSLNQAGVDLSKTLEAALLPDSMKIKWDPYFEQQGVQIAFHAKDEEDLEQSLEKLKSPAFKNIFKHI